MPGISTASFLSIADGEAAALTQGGMMVGAVRRPPQAAGGVVPASGAGPKQGRAFVRQPVKTRHVVYCAGLLYFREHLR
ncbi:hypothetical protein [Azospirillum sp. SYSU D00513]|uniref:hypothetical protein n=1 Tax=Azospirillum sp. SYSU D00513 TaxID=2812561 RepID=UPI001A96487C|nr:hypothetical protein [Azospirillum sp. SYSU D00513]